MTDIQAFSRGRPATQARGEDTRRRILETALDLFSAHGYEGASTRQIAEGPGVNLPAIQYYFGNKEGLYRAVIGDIVEHTEMHLAPPAANAEPAVADPNTRPDELPALWSGMAAPDVTVSTCARPS